MSILGSLDEIVSVVAGSATYALVEGDCLEWLGMIPDECIDAVITDPPYGLGTREPKMDEIIAYLHGADLNTGGDFMGKRWSVPSVAIWREVFRVLKPGAHVLCFGGTRTFDLISLGLRAAGFENRDTISEEGVLRWVYGSGFPKSLDVSKAIDKAAGAEREVVGQKTSGIANREEGKRYTVGASESVVVDVTVPATPETKRWDGWGTALKPSWEPVLVFRKPLVGTVVQTVLRHGTGAMNIGGCRVGDDERVADPVWGMDSYYVGKTETAAAHVVHGRWPSNLILSHTPECRCVGTKHVDGNGHWPAVRGAGGLGTAGHAGQDNLDEHHDGGEVESWECAPDCPVAAMNDQSGESTSPSSEQHVVGSMGYHGGGKGYMAPATIGDHGGASRFFPTFMVDGHGFFYTSKAARSERDAGLNHLPAFSGGQATSREEESAGLDSPRAGAGRKGGARNVHPTVKPLDLMSWLCRLITPPGGVVLDPFAGSGSTPVAALRQGFRAIGIEREAQYVTIARARIEEDEPLFRRQRGKGETASATSPPVSDVAQGDLFANLGVEASDD